MTKTPMPQPQPMQGQSRYTEEPSALLATAIETDIKTAIETARHSLRILDSVKDAFLTVDREWRITYINAEAARINHKPAQAFIGRTHWEEWPASVGTEVERQYRRAMSERILVQFEHHYFVRDEYDVWLEISAYPADEQDGGGLHLVYHDITRQKHLENELRRSEERYRALVDASSQIVWTNSPEGEMHGPQPRWCAFTGQTEHDVQGYGWSQAVHPDDAQPTLDAWNEAVRTTSPFLFEHRLRRRDGVWRTFAVRAVPVLEADKGAIREWVGIHTDVTESKEREAERQALLAQQRTFLKEMLSSITEGRLLLCDGPEELPAPLAPSSPVIMLTSQSLRRLRQEADRAAEEIGFSRERLQDLTTATSEAGMNAVVHAGGGEGRVCADDRAGMIQVWVRDNGKGIAYDAIHMATLERGFSSAGTLGHGFSMMLQCADRVHLMTGSTGTTVVLEQRRSRPVPLWLDAPNSP